MVDEAITLAYYGVAAFKITTPKGKKILIDPYITGNQMCSEKLEYFHDVDLMLVTHGSYDHLGDTIEIMRQSNAILVCGRDVASYALDMGIPAQRVRATLYGDEKDFDGVRVKTVNALHNSRIDTETKSYIGMPMGFVVSAENGIRIYHAGDGAIFGDLRLVGMLYRPNILLVGISDAAAGKMVQMTSREAALATLWIGPDVVVPMHYPARSREPQRFCEVVKMIAPDVEPLIMEPNSQVTFSKYRLEVHSSCR